MPGISPFFFRIVTSLALAGLTVYLGFWVQRSDFQLFIAAYGLFFCIYVYLLFQAGWTAEHRRWLLALGIGLRVILLFSLPSFSDDFYRFLWDGRLAAQGIHPFAHTPAYFIENQIPLRGITPELFQKLNSPQYYTVYPPVCQAVFWVAAKLFPQSVAGGVLVLKLFLLGCEIGTVMLLSKSQNVKGKSQNVKGRSQELPESVPLLPPKRRFPGSALLTSTSYILHVDFKKAAAVCYALNPLAILEIVGNCHFEGAMLCFLLAGLYRLRQSRPVSAAVWWALAVASKLLPLMLLPIVLTGLSWRQGLRFLLAFGAVSVLLFLPLLDGQVMANMAGSLNLYFRQFEFNASVYYLLKLAGEALAPPKMDVARTLGPALGAVVFLSILGMALYLVFCRVWVFSCFRASGSPGLRGERFMVIALTLYLALATTVHPWYIVPLFGLSLLTPWRFPLVWTAAVALSYSHYAGGHFQENYWLIGLEYMLVFFAAGRDVYRLTIDDYLIT